MLHQPVDQMQRELSIDRIGARGVILEKALPVLDVPFRKTLMVLLVLLVAVEDGVAVIDREGRPGVFQIGFVLVVAHDDQCIELRAVERVADVGHRRPHLILPRHERCGRDHRRHFGVGLFQKLGIGRGPAFLVAVLDVLVGLGETRQRFIGSKQHRRVGATEPENNLCHPHLLKTNSLRFLADASTITGNGGGHRGEFSDATLRNWTTAGGDVGMRPIQAG